MHFPQTLQAPLEAAERQALRALLEELGEKSKAYRFQVAPNPCVGACILSDGVEIGRGFHEVWGGPHAELRALRAAGKSGVPQERWDTMVITLEPCSSEGKTPPCTEALLAAGIRRVIVACLDPDPRHRGRGLEALHRAGVEVFLIEPSAPLQKISPHFLSWTSSERLRRQRPWTLAKWAQTRTGQLVPPEDVGGGRWISGPMALGEVQVMRGRMDAIVTGVETCLNDDPRLSVRPPGDLDHPPLRVVLDTELRLSPTARLLQPLPDDEGHRETRGQLIVLCRPGASAVRRRALERAGARVETIRLGDDGRLSLRDVQSWLWQAGVRRLMLEAGATLLKSWFQAELVDQVAVYTGNINGGRGQNLAEYLAPPRLLDVDHREVGEDAILEGFVRPL